MSMLWPHSGVRWILHFVIGAVIGAVFLYANQKGNFPADISLWVYAGKALFFFGVGCIIWTLIAGFDEINERQIANNTYKKSNLPRQWFSQKGGANA